MGILVSACIVGYAAVLVMAFKVFRALWLVMKPTRH